MQYEVTGMSAKQPVSVIEEKFTHSRKWVSVYLCFAYDLLNCFYITLNFTFVQY